MAAVPASLSVRIVSGMRWTLWLSVLSAPFSYGTSVILARVGPEVIGTYGLLMLYVAIVSCLFYLGGDAVVIKFVPELQAGKRLAFLLSYFLVIIAALVPWLVLATLWPGVLHWVFGARSGRSVQLWALYLSPVYILFSLAVADLKAVLDMRWANTLLRLLTIGTFAAYAILYLGFRDLLQAHYTVLVWGIYLALTALLWALGMWRLLLRKGRQSGLRSLRFFLPPGFWRYTLSLQENSVLGLVSGRLDYVLILNSGGLAVLGEYVALMQFAQTIQAAGNYFLDTLLPALTNLLASGNRAGASRVFSMHLRILFVFSIGVVCALMFLAQPLTALLGPKYVSLGRLLVLLLLFLGLSLPGSIGGTLLTSAGKQQQAVWVKMGQLGLFVILFFALWPHWGLLGAILAFGASLFASNVALLAVARFSGGLQFPAFSDYSKFVLVGGAAGAFAITVLPHHLFYLAAPAWAAAVGAFLYLAHYGWAECLALARCYVPGHFLDRRIQMFSRSAARVKDIRKAVFR
jgi:O-antigen/teichoic acid export membrane protein